MFSKSSSIFNPLIPFFLIEDPPVKVEVSVTLKSLSPQSKFPFKLIDIDFKVSVRLAVIFEVGLSVILPFNTSASIGPLGTITI